MLYVYGLLARLFRYSFTCDYRLDSTNQIVIINKHKDLIDEKYNSEAETLVIFLGWNQRKLETKTEEFYPPNFTRKLLWKKVAKLAEIPLDKLFH